MAQNNIGRTLYISDALPATNDAAGFEALTWTRVNGEIRLPQLGVDHGVIDVPFLDGFTVGLKGAGAGVDATMEFSIVSGDSGQSTLQTQADDSGGVLSIKIGRGSGTAGALVTGDPVQYAQGFVRGYQENEITNTTYEGFTVTFRQNDFTVTATEPA